MPSGMTDPLISLSPASLSLTAVGTTGNQPLAEAAKASTLPDYNALDLDDTIDEVKNQPVNKPDKQTNNIGPIGPSTNFSRSGDNVAIQFTKVTKPKTNYVNFKNPVGWNDFKYTNGKDVDLYRFEVKAGDRIMIQAETTPVEHTFVDPFKKQGGKPVNLQDKRQVGIALRLFDHEGKGLPNGIGGDPQVHVPQPGQKPDGTVTWQLPFTFSADGTYYLGVSEYGNTTYDAKTGNDDYPGSASFGKYTLNIRYLEQHLPDLAARDIRWLSSGLQLTYDVSQKVIAGVGRPDEWRLGGKLYWVSEDGTWISEAASDRMAVLAGIKVGYNDRKEQKFFVSNEALGIKPYGATHLAFVMNADGKTPEPSRLNNIKLLSLEGATSADLRATRTDAEDGKTVSYRYEVVNQPLTGDYQVAIYRGSQPDFSSDMELVQAVPMPALDEEGDKATELGTHSITVTFANEIRGTASRPYLFVVAVPVGAETFSQGSIVEADLANNAAPLGRITSQQLMYIIPTLPSADAERYVDVINRAMGEFGIISYKRQAAFIGQLAGETGLSTWKEDWDKKYHKYRKDRDGYTATSKQDYFNYWYNGDNGNGNYASGDGYKYRGRGPIQLTGKNNYGSSRFRVGKKQ